MTSGRALPRPTVGVRLDDDDRGASLAFTSVLAALSCAKQVLRDRLDTATGPGLRVGVAVEAEGRGGVPPASLAAALCAHAEPGQVLVSPAARALAVGRPGYEFRELGAGALVVGGASIGVWELLWREPEPRTRVRLCGRLELEIDGHDLAQSLPGGQAGTVLRYLLAAGERSADRDELIDVLWPARPPKDPQGDLRPVLSRLRRAVAPATVEGRERLRLVLPEPVWVDVEEAAGAIEAARAAAKGSLWESTREQSEAALDVLRGGFLPDHDARVGRPAEARAR